MRYKPLSEPQPRMPPGYGIIHVDHHYHDGENETLWYPVKLVEIDSTLMLDHISLQDPGNWRVIFYHDRRRAITCAWRFYERDQMRSALGLPEKTAPCSYGVPGNWYQHEKITVAGAVERLGLPKSFILKLIKNKDIKAYLHTSKERGKGYTYFTNYYTFNLAHLEAYLDRHGYHKAYPSYAERQRQLGASRKLPAIIWCV